MCRFLLLHAQETDAVHQVAQAFAQMCQHSTGPEGSAQGDGWGVAWRHDDGQWRLHRSVAPIWTETQVLQQLPLTRHVVVHARRASFARHQGEVLYNQPYLWENYAFVFNGFVKGVKLRQPVPGTIGAEKIWYLVRQQLQRGAAPADALERVYTLLSRHSRELRACNMGLHNGQELVVYNGNPSATPYYDLHHVYQTGLRMIGSEPFGHWAWQRPAGS